MTANTSDHFQRVLVPFFCAFVADRQGSFFSDNLLGCLTFISQVIGINKCKKKKTSVYLLSILVLWLLSSFGWRNRGRLIEGVGPSSGERLEGYLQNQLLQIPGYRISEDTG